jgi:putative endonuclease
MQMEFYVYILQSDKDGSYYFGQTNNLDDRLKRHNAGSEKYTSKKTPWKLFWYTKVSTRAEAMKLEKKLKNLKSTKRMMEFIDKYRADPLA